MFTTWSTYIHIIYCQLKISFPQHLSTFPKSWKWRYILCLVLCPGWTWQPSSNYHKTSILAHIFRVSSHFTVVVYCRLLARSLFKVMQSMSHSAGGTKVVWLVWSIKVWFWGNGRFSIGCVTDWLIHYLMLQNKFHVQVRKIYTSKSRDTRMHRYSGTKRSHWCRTIPDCADFIINNLVSSWSVKPVLSHSVLLSYQYF